MKQGGFIDNYNLTESQIENIVFKSNNVGYGTKQQYRVYEDLLTKSLPETFIDGMPEKVLSLKNKIQEEMKLGKFDDLNHDILTEEEREKVSKRKENVSTESVLKAVLEKAIYNKSKRGFLDFWIWT